jgi:hypothetical protein
VSLVDGFATSGFSKAAYCIKQGIATSCLYRWQKVFPGQRASADLMVITESVSSPLPVDGNSQWHVELELGGGIV